MIRPIILFFLIPAFAGFGLRLESADLALIEKAKEFHEAKLQPNEAVVFGRVEGEAVSFGAAGLLGEGRAEADEDSLFEIGSITKVFTGILLADLVLEGKISLDDSIVDVLDDLGVEVGEDLGPVTFLELATHTSGLPRLPPNL
ncbi:MAG: serine hydrolase domain-containing protein, partial [Verrucomicrobiota bacterium]